MPSPDGRILGVDGLALAMPAQPNSYLAQMARFSEGDLHAEHRAAASAQLPLVKGLEAAALAATTAVLTDRFDAVPMVLTLPVDVLAASMGLAPLSSAVGELVDQGAASPTLLGDTQFGAGAHACPGRDHAFALAAGVLDALGDHEVVEVGPNLPRPNMRLPSSLILQRR